MGMAVIPDHTDEVAKLTRFPWQNWPWMACRYQVHLVNWGKGALVPGVDFNHFKGEESGIVIKMVHP